MPFDPSLPVNHTKIVAAELRAQFTGLFDLIQTIPQGPQGVPGPAGTSVTGAVVDGVSTVNPGDPATASASFDGATVHLSFGLPRGPDGTPGADGGEGPQGLQGLQGDLGPQRPAFTGFNVASTTTLEPGQPATVQAVFDGTSVQFTFGLPRGADGQRGVDGVTGPQGPSGEVTAAQLAAAIAGTASNTNPVVTLDLSISDPPTQGELQQVVAKLNELIVGLRRA